MLSGSCLCGAVSYEIDAPIESASHCHCSQCRKATARRSPPTAGAPRGPLCRRSGRSGRIPLVARRHPYLLPPLRIEPAVAWWQRGPDVHLYRPRHLDSPLPSVAQRHIYVGSKADWYVIADDLPQEHHTDRRSRAGINGQQTRSQPCCSTCSTKCAQPRCLCRCASLLDRRRLKHRVVRRHGRVLLPGAHHHGDERHFDKFDRPSAPTSRAWRSSTTTSRR